MYHLGSQGSLKGAERREPFLRTRASVQGVALGTKPCGFPKEFSKLIRVEGRSRHRAQHIQSQEAEGCLWGRGRNQELVDLGKLVGEEQYRGG